MTSTPGANMRRDSTFSPYGELGGIMYVRAHSELVKGNLDNFEIVPTDDGTIALWLQIEGTSVLASLGPAYASFLAKQLRTAAAKIHLGENRVYPV
jgi:hypothetical protein